MNYIEDVTIANILLMENDKKISAIEAEVLTRAGYMVELVSNGSEAVEKYRKAKETEKPFRLVILDRGAEGEMGGVETIGELLKIDPDIKAVISTGYPNDHIIDDYKTKYGFKGILLRYGNNYEVDDIVRVVEKVLGVQGG